MRDLYNRPKMLEYWVGRAQTDFTGTDKEDVLKLIHNMEDKERSSLRIVRCITALIMLRCQLNKPFRDATRDDIRQLLRWMDGKYKASSNEKFRQVLKLFYKVAYGNGEEYPDMVKWFSSKVSKEKRGAQTAMDMTLFLEEHEVEMLVQAGSSMQRKAFCKPV